MPDTFASTYELLTSLIGLAPDLFYSRPDIGANSGERPNPGLLKLAYLAWHC